MLAEQKAIFLEWHHKFCSKIKFWTENILDLYPKCWSSTFEIVDPQPQTPDLDDNVNTSTDSIAFEDSPFYWSYFDDPSD